MDLEADGLVAFELDQERVLHPDRNAGSGADEILGDVNQRHCVADELDL